MHDRLPPAAHYQFRDWVYAPEQRLLSGPSGAVRIKPLLDRLLRRLLDEPGNVLSREMLIEQVWTRRQVNDEVLSRAIAELRALLHDDAREPRFIETLSKGGYRWIAEVTSIARQPAAGPVPREQPAPALQPNRRRRLAAWIGTIAIAVLLILGYRWQHQNKDRGKRDRVAANLLGAHPLTADPRLEYDARFDPIGRVVYIRSDPDSDASELIMVDPTSHAERVLWKDPLPLRHPAPSPDGREIAVIRVHDSVCELWTITLVDSRHAQLGECARQAIGGLEWTDAGAGLLYTGSAADVSHAPGLMLLNRASGKQRAVTTPPAAEGAHVDPRLSADGKVLVYASRRAGERQLWWTDWPRLQQRSALLKRPEPVFGHAFEADGRTLWVAGDLVLYRALHRLRAGGEPELIGGRGARSIDLAADGTAVWSEADYDADIWLQRGAGGAWTSVARSNRYESQPEFSGDGQRLALISNRNGAESALVFDLGDGSTRQLLLDPNKRWVRPSWSAKDQSLILTAYEERHTRLYRYQLETEVLSALALVEQDAFQGIELSDRLLYLSAHGSDHSTLMQLRDGHTRPENLGLGSVTAYRASNAWVAWRTRGSPILKAAPLPGLKPIREIERVDSGLDETMALSGDKLYFMDKDQIWKLVLPDSQPIAVPVARVPDAAGPNLAVSPDGSLAVVTQSSLSMDLMIAEPGSAGN
jgi:DNA-binding winged helix-turn-helix (wHTH) protein/Tol biopolymer transport system component